MSTIIVTDVHKDQYNYPDAQHCVLANGHLEIFKRMPNPEYKALSAEDKERWFHIGVPPKRDVVVAVYAASIWTCVNVVN